MADIPEVVSADPNEMLVLGRRHLAVKDYSSAVSSLGMACELLAQKYGQTADECGEAYFWYGKSLLGLSRVESGVLGDGLPGGDENQEDEEEEDEDAVDEDNNEETEKNESESKTEKTDDSKDASESKDKAVSDDKNDNEPDSSEMETEQNANAESSKDVKEPVAESTSAAGTSSSVETEAVDNEEEDEVENLQVAWEVFELARDVFIKREEKGKKELADVYLHLGEVSLESEMYDKAISDMSKSLELFQELYNSDDRRIAETHYQIGLAHSLSNGFDDAVSHFRSAADIIESRIKNLQAPSASTENADVKKNLAADPFYSIEGEVKELTDLLPEIKEKIQDMIDYKAEALRHVRESLVQTKMNGESSKTNGSSSSKPVEEKKVSDISHLVKRKRKADDDSVTEGSSVPKKMAN